MRWKWNNIPIPEPHSAGLIIGAVLQKFFSKNLFDISWIGHVSGVPLLLVGIGICAWAVIEAKEMAIESPDMLLKTGPYALSRNPMYVGWTLIYIGISLAANSVWIVAILPIVILYIHFVAIRKEEQFLEERFGVEFRQYRDRVRRYL